MTEAATIQSPFEPWVNAPASMTPDGVPLELVRLADVVRWLMTAKRLHFVPAVHAMHKALAGFEGLRLYIADGLGMARAVGASNVFGLTVPTMLRTYNVDIDMHTTLTVQPQSLRDGVLPGQPAALYFVRNVWGNGRNAETIMDSDHVQAVEAAWLAMPCEQAAQLWGSNDVVVLVESSGPLTYSAMLEQRKHKPFVTWTDAQINALKIEDEKRREQPGSGGRESIAKDLTLTVSRIHQLVTGERKSKRQSGPSKKPASVK